MCLHVLHCCTFAHDIVGIMLVNKMWIIAYSKIPASDALVITITYMTLHSTVNNPIHITMANTYTYTVYRLSWFNHPHSASYNRTSAPCASTVHVCSDACDVGDSTIAACSEPGARRGMH